jgi:putative metalloprotease
MHFLLPIGLAVIIGLVSYLFSVNKTKQALDLKSKPLQSPELENKICALAMALDLTHLNVNVYNIETINGLAAPGGQIYITQGFLSKFNKGEVSATEIVSVIAHELGHVALGHTRRRMIDFSGQNALRTALSITLNRFIPVIGPWLANLAVTIIAARMSRKDEFEADSYATALMLKSGLGIQSQKSLLQKLDKLTGGAESVPAWFMSHPKAGERVKAIELNEKKWTGTVS